MSRRMALPGAEELFRTTGAHPAAIPEPGEGLAGLTEREALGGPDDQGSVGGRPLQAHRPRSVGGRRPTGRERHDEKITVYVSAEELMDLERARLTLRGDHGMAVDRGRIVREALAMILADLETKGEASTLVRRLRGR